MHGQSHKAEQIHWVKDTNLPEQLGESNQTNLLSKRCSFAL